MLSLSENILFSGYYKAKLHSLCTVCFCLQDWRRWRSDRYVTLPPSRFVCPFAFEQRKKWKQKTVGTPAEPSMHRADLFKTWVALTSAMVPGICCFP